MKPSSIKFVSAKFLESLEEKLRTFLSSRKYSNVYLQGRN